ncbi:MAG: hypothetical protein ACJAU9_000802, partial [Lentimonas sp.]
MWFQLKWFRCVGNFIHSESDDYFSYKTLSN